MPSRTRIFLLVAPSIVLLLVLLWQIKANSAAKTALEGRIATLSGEIGALKARPAAASQPAMQARPPVMNAPNPAPQPLAGASSRNDAAVLKLQESLAAARSQISELESQVLSLQADRATLTQQRQQEVAAAGETCRAHLAEVQKSLESAQVDLKAAQQRASLFEAENANLRKTPAPSAKSAARADEGGELDELARRRDTYLKNLIRRYREIDTEYRAMLNTLDARRDPQSSSHPNDAAVFRIQSSLAQAEDDLRQIDSLNAKTLLVEKRHEKN